MTALLAAILGFFAYPIVIGIFGLLLTILFTASAEYDDDDGTSAVRGFTIFFLILAAVVYHKYVFEFIGNWQLCLISLLVYGIVGGAWSVFRWFKYCKKYVAEHPYTHPERDWENGKETTLTAEQYYLKKLQASKYKTKITNWIVYWPWSMAWNLLGDFFVAIYDALSNAYLKVTTAVIKKAVKSRQ